MVSMGRPLLLWLDYHDQFKIGFLAHSFVKGTLLLLGLLFGLTIGYSRLFLGVHSLDQVLYGYLLGLWFTITWHYLVKNKLMFHVNTIILGRVKKYSVLYGSVSALFAVTILLSMVNYAIVNATFVSPQSWTDEIIEKCGAEKMSGAYQNHSLLDLGEVSPGFGAYYGLLLQSQVWGGMVLFGTPKTHGFLKMLGRCAIAGVVGGPFLLMSLIGESQVPNVYLLMFIASIIPYTIGSYLVFGVCDTICLKLNLYDKV